jgi:hypothetical protein
MLSLVATNRLSRAGSGGGAGPGGTKELAVLDTPELARRVLAAAAAPDGRHIALRKDATFTTVTWPPAALDAVQPSLFHRQCQVCS